MYNWNKLGQGVNAYVLGDPDTEHQLWCEQTEEGAHCSDGVQKPVQTLKFRCL